MAVVKSDVRVPTGLRIAARRRARENDSTMSAMVRGIITAYVAGELEVPKVIEDGSRVRYTVDELTLRTARELAQLQGITVSDVIRVGLEKQIA